MPVLPRGGIGIARRHGTERPLVVGFLCAMVQLQLPRCAGNDVAWAVREEAMDGKLPWQPEAGEPRISMPPAGANVCLDHFFVQVLGLENLGQWGGEGDVSVKLTWNGAHIISARVDELAASRSYDALISPSAYEWSLSDTGPHILQLDVISHAEEGVRIPLYTNIVAFRVSNDLTCLQRPDLIRLAEEAETRAGRACRQKQLAAMHRQQDLLLSSLMGFSPHGLFLLPRPPSFVVPFVPYILLAHFSDVSYRGVLACTCVSFAQRRLCNQVDGS